LFVDLRNISGEPAAQQIHGDAVDILIDLSGQIRGSRLEITALRLVPVQVAYIGFLGSNVTGFIDYVFSERTVSPLDHLGHYSEAPAYVPHCYLITEDN
jgi:predicted O-linked N-acetylglucosamine transferase (SPINDLY family)